MTAEAKLSPILFNPEMVEAILAKDKTQTRRIVRTLRDVGVVGSVLWVREAWRVWSWREGDPIGIQTRDGEHHEDTSDGMGIGYGEWYVRMASQSYADMEKAGAPLCDDLATHYCVGDPPTRWRPSIHMPKWASRIRLLVTRVRIERVQNITEEDAIAEGIWFDGQYWRAVTHPIKGGLKCWPSAREAFRQLWDSIYAKQGRGWDTNPLVGVLYFERQVK